MYLSIQFQTEFDNPFYSEKILLPQIKKELQKRLYGILNDKQLNKLLNRIIDKNGNICSKRKAFKLIIREQKILAKEMYAPRIIKRTID